MKKYVSIIMALLLCMSLSVTAFAKGGMENFEAAKEYTGFSDIAEAAWYHGSVKAAFEYGLIKGASPTEFQPDGTLTVAEAIVMADRIHMLYETGEDTLVNGTPWYQTYVDYAIENGLITEGDFDDYNRNITRGEMADIFTRALPDEEYEVINDIPEELPLDIVGHRYEDSIRMLFRAGIVTGNDPYGTYTPDANIKRCEAAAIISRIVDVNLRKYVTLLTDWEFDDVVTVAAPHSALAHYFEDEESDIDEALELSALEGSIAIYKTVNATDGLNISILAMPREEIGAGYAEGLGVDPEDMASATVMFGDIPAYRYSFNMEISDGNDEVVTKAVIYMFVHKQDMYIVTGISFNVGESDFDALADQVLRDMINNVKVNGAAPSAKLS